MLIGLIGSPRSGKDSVADLLVKEYNFKKIAFADRIKKEYFPKIGITEEEYESLKKAGKCKEVREKLWNYSKGRKYAKGQDYFVNLVLDEIDGYSWVITDIRTKLELERVQAADAHILVVKRNELDEIEDSEFSNESLKAFDSIVNNGTIDDLKEDLEQYFVLKKVLS